MLKKCANFKLESINYTISTWFVDHQAVIYFEMSPIQNYRFKNIDVNFCPRFTANKKNHI